MNKTFFIKTYVTLFISLVIDVSAICQQGLEWAPMGAVWVYEQQRITPFDPITYRSLIVTADTIVQGRSCRVVSEKKTIQGRNYLLPVAFTYENNGRVFAMNPYYPGTTFSLIYDFNALEGDTIESAFNGENLIMVIDSIREFEQNGIQYKTQFVSTLNGPFEQYYIEGPVITGIGNVEWLLPNSRAADPPEGGWLICYQDHNKRYNVPEGEECGLVNNLKREFPQVKIFPNPAKGQFRVVSDQTINELKVYDQLGRLIVLENDKDRNAGTYFSIVIDDPGVYFLVLKIGNDYISRKILIQ